MQLPGSCGMIHQQLIQALLLRLLCSRPTYYTHLLGCTLLPRGNSGNTRRSHTRRSHTGSHGRSSMRDKIRAPQRCAGFGKLRRYHTARRHPRAGSKDLGRPSRRSWGSGASHDALASNTGFLDRLTPRSCCYNSRSAILRRRGHDARRPHWCRSWGVWSDTCLQRRSWEGGASHNTWVSQTGFFVHLTPGICCCIPRNAIRRCRERDAGRPNGCRLRPS
mmetsp:Transcript_11159/g.24592  ORF Transcript_11159/g.24592 Transcript_11159/m.24592 type:complete len:220 (-) Transcript_11159:339-998(-)